MRRFGLAVVVCSWLGGLPLATGQETQPFASPEPLDRPVVRLEPRLEQAAEPSSQAAPERPDVQPHVAKPRDAKSHDAKSYDSLATMPTMTPEMWLYLNEQRRADDPENAIRRRAEAKAAQREKRIETARWYGFQPARPVASGVPVMGVYSPMWVGNSWNPFYWTPGGYWPTSVVRVEHVESRR